MSCAIGAHSGFSFPVRLLNSLEAQTNQVQFLGWNFIPVKDLVKNNEISVVREENLCNRNCYYLLFYLLFICYYLLGFVGGFLNRGARSRRLFKKSFPVF